MTQYVAFLRAINVGGHTVKMDYLRKLFEQMDFVDVETFIASGNVIFSSPSSDTQALENMVEQHLKASLGYEVVTFIRSAAEVAKVAGWRPFAAEDIAVEGHSLYVGFLQREPSKEAREKLMSLRTDVDDFHINGRELYWLCRIRMSDSKFSGGLLEKTLGMPATLRNITTVRKLAAKYPA